MSCMALSRGERQVCRSRASKLGTCECMGANVMMVFQI